jgi:hypothetical protein
LFPIAGVYGPTNCNNHNSDTLCDGQCLRPGQTLFSCNGLSSIANYKGQFFYVREEVLVGYLTFNATNPVVFDPPEPLCEDTALCMISPFRGQLVLSGCGTRRNIFDYSNVRPDNCIQIFDGGDIFTSLNKVRQNPFFEMLKAPNCNNKLCAGQCIEGGQRITSCKGQSWIRVDSRRVLIEGGEQSQAIYDTFQVCEDMTLCMEPSGRLVIKGCNNLPSRYSIDIIPSVDPGNCLEVLDDGAAEIVNNGQLLAKIGALDQPPRCNDKLCAGQCLKPGQRLTSCNGLSSIANTNGQYIRTGEPNDGFSPESGQWYLTFRRIGFERANPVIPDFCEDTELCMELSGQLVLYSCGTNKTLLPWSTVRPDHCVQIFDGGAIYTSLSSGTRYNDFRGWNA